MGAARIIDIDDPRHPKVVSNIRLAVHQPQRATATSRTTRGRSSPVQGYAATTARCPGAPTPNLVACSMILSGLRVFDIRDVRTRRRSATSTSRSRSVRTPATRASDGAYAMSQPAWDAERRSVWYTDGNSGFYDVRLTNGLQDLL